MPEPIDIEKELMELDEEAKQQKILEEKKREEEERRQRELEQLRLKEEEKKRKRLMRPEDFDEDFILPIVDNTIIQVGCGFRDCSDCCHETEMILTEADLQRLEDAGYDRKEFCLDPNDTDGFFQLRNKDGKCFFLSESGKCKVYNIRPEGCRLYPLILTLDTNEVVVDDDCREREWFEEQVYERAQVMAVHSLVSTLLLERRDVIFDE